MDRPNPPRLLCKKPISSRDIRIKPEARFFCALSLARPDGGIEARFEGTANGRILEERRGTRDFGYDPYFLFTEAGHPQTERSFAELEPEEKSAVSHRGRALAALRDYLSTATQRA